MGARPGGGEGPCLWGQSVHLGRWQSPGDQGGDGHMTACALTATQAPWYVYTLQNG